VPDIPVAGASYNHINLRCFSENPEVLELLINEKICDEFLGLSQALDRF